MSWFRRRRAPMDEGPSPTSRASVSEVHVPTTPVCDSCNADLPDAGGYYLTTRTVLASEAYWVKRLEMGRSLWNRFGLLRADSMPRLFDESILLAARNATAWAICEECSELFVCDRNEARSYAADRVQPPGCGPVEPEAIAFTAARAWERVFGEWPARVARPAARDSCDVCRKKIYEPEVVSALDQTTYDSWRAAGHFGREVARTSPRASEGRARFLVCQSCLARGLANVQRAESARADS